ncbi:UDP-3-O-acylglucosamine N-acyltransferase [Burkholderiales bacterium GJ-E10]|nr:UDP-3-O-acylglucosamine N-acyltransferase [Burkholderiales bacterium GJ-E10]
MAEAPGGTFSVADLIAEVQRRSHGALVAVPQGGAGVAVSGTAALDAAGPGDLAFLSNPRYRAMAAQSGAGAIVLSGADCAALFPEGRAHGALIVCDAPYAWYAFAAQALASAETVVPGCAASAAVAPDARIDPAARIDAHAVVGAGAVVEAGAWIGPGCVLGSGVQVGAESRLYGGVQIYAGCRIGRRAIIHSGAVIGADGFGFAPLRGTWVKIPQTGIVRIGDDVEIGANTTIDRGSAEDTVVEDGVKIDNQVQIGHNCRIGAHTAIAGCVGIAGSAVIGRNCQIGGAAMIHGHLQIVDGTIVAAGTLVSRSLREPDFYTGVFPMMRNRDWERNAALLRHLVELRDRIRRLEALQKSNPANAPGSGDQDEKTS